MVEMFEGPGDDNYSITEESDPTGRGSHDPGAKNDAGKTEWALLPWEIVEGVADVMTFGKAKYSEEGWKEVPEAKRRYFSAMFRHWRAIMKGEYLAADSGLPHWAHFCANALFLGYFYLKDKK